MRNVLSRTDIERLTRGYCGLSLARELQPMLQKPIQRRNTKQDGWVLEIGGKVVAEVQRDDNGEWRWQRMSTLARRGLPPGSGRATSRRDAQKKAWPKAV